MRTRSEKGQISIVPRTNQADVLLQMLQTQKTRGLHHERCEGKICRSD